MSGLRIAVPEECTLAEAISRCSPWHPCRAADLYVGKRVLARLRADTAEFGRDEDNMYCPARIVAVNSFGTYSVQFVATKDRQEATPLKDIKLEIPVEKDNFDELLENPGTIVVRDGVHDLRGIMVDIDFPVTIVGQSQGKTIVLGGFRIGGDKARHQSRPSFSVSASSSSVEGHSSVHISHLTIRGSTGSGIYAYNGLSVVLRQCTITDCQRFGVMIFSSCGRLENVQVKSCGESGIACHSGGEIYLSQPPCANKWAKMIVVGNCTKNRACSFGLDAGYANGRILLVRPLSKDQVAYQNQGGGNYCGNTIRQVESDR